MFKKVLRPFLVILSTVLVFSCTSTGANSPAPMAPEATKSPQVSASKALESFEKSADWFAVGGSWNDGDSSVEAEASEKNASDGTSSLECIFVSKEGGKYATFYTEALKVDNWKNYSSLSMDIFNPLDLPGEAWIALCTGDTWEWLELQPRERLTEKSMNAVQFDLTGTETFRSAVTKENGKLKNADMVKRLVVRFRFDEPVKGSVFIDNLRLNK